jgi:F0F1-type ATP synthase beta subunit
MGKMSEQDRATLAFWRKTHPKASAKNFKEGQKVKLKGTKISGKIIEVRTGSKATLFSSQGVGKPVKVSGIGKVLSIAIKGSDGRLHFGNPKDFRKLDNPCKRRR